MLTMKKISEMIANSKDELRQSSPAVEIVESKETIPPPQESSEEKNEEQNENEINEKESEEKSNENENENDEKEDKEKPLEIEYDGDTPIFIPVPDVKFYSVFVSGLPTSWKSSDLRDHFKTDNPIDCKIVMNHEEGISRGFGYCDFVEESDALKFIQKFKRLFKLETY